MRLGIDLPNLVTRRARGTLDGARAWGRGDLIRVLSRDRLLQTAGAGLVAGVVAGAAMPLLTLIVAIAAGQSPWAAPRVIASTFVGQPDPGRDLPIVLVLVGTAMHLLLAGSFGIMYALVTSVARRPPAVPAQILGGALWGLGRWTTNSFVIAPRLPGGQDLPAAMPPWTWLVGHLLYGALLGLLYARWRHDQPLRTTRIVRGIVGALAVELGVLLVGLALFERVAPLASFVFAGAAIGGGALALLYGARRTARQARYGGLWALLAGLTLLLWDILRVA